MTAPRTPVVFIHGLWLHATSWTPWLELFAQAGYDPIAPGWPGEPDTTEQARQQPELVADTSIDDVTAHYAKIIDSLDASPVIIGHSFGGLIAEKLLGQGIGAAAVAIDPAQIKGVLPLPLAQLRAALPGPGQPGESAQGRRPSPRRSSSSASATRCRRRSPPSCSASGRFPLRPARCSRPRRPTSPSTQRRRLTPATRPAARCCSSPVPRTIPSRTWSPARP